MNIFDGRWHLKQKNLRLSGLNILPIKKMGSWPQSQFFNKLLDGFSFRPFFFTGLFSGRCKKYAIVVKRNIDDLV